MPGVVGVVGVHVGPSEEGRRRAAVAAGASTFAVPRGPLLDLAGRLEGGNTLPCRANSSSVVTPPSRL